MGSMLKTNFLTHYFSGYCGKEKELIVLEKGMQGVKGTVTQFAQNKAKVSKRLSGIPRIMFI